MRKAGVRRTVFLCFIFVFSILAFRNGAAEDGGRPSTLALLPIENKSADPRYDYLSSIMEGLILFDLAGIEDLRLVERSNLERVLEEQKLKLSGITEGDESIMDVGKILGADYLVSGNYVFLGEDILMRLTLVDTATARTATFTERGYTDNTIHSLAQQLVFHLTGKRPVFGTPGQDRSVLSMRDETPGTIVLYSPLIDAEIFLDGEFAGYTTGNPREPFVLEEVPPGRHTLRVHLGGGFGVVELPRIEFRDWEKEISLSPGKKAVLRDESRDFNGTLYALRRVLEEDYTQSETDRKRIEKRYSLSFRDREGTEQKIEMTAVLIPLEKERRLDLFIAMNGKKYTYRLDSREEETVGMKESLGIVTLQAEIEHRWKRFDVEYSLLREDIRQGMWREE